MYMILVRKNKWRPLGIPRHRLKDNIGTDHNETGWNNAEQWAVQKMVMNILVLQNATNLLTSWGLVGFQDDSSPQSQLAGWLVSGLVSQLYSQSTAKIRQVQFQ